MDNLRKYREQAHPNIQQHVSRFLITPVIRFRRNIVRKRTLRPIFRFFVGSRTTLIRVLIISPRKGCRVTRSIFQCTISPERFRPYAGQATSVIRVRLPIVVHSVSSQRVNVRRDGHLFFIKHRLLIGS